MKLVIVTTASTGLESGSTIFQKIRIRPAPSMSAASSSSPGSDRKNWRSRKMSSTEATFGRIRPHPESNMPSAWVMWMRGTSRVIVGTIMPASSTANSLSLPGKGMRAKA